MTSVKDTINSELKRKERRKKEEKSERSLIEDENMDGLLVEEGDKTRKKEKDEIMEIYKSDNLEAVKSNLSFQSLFETIWANSSFTAKISSERYAEVVLADANITHKIALLLGAAFGSLTVSKFIEFKYNGVRYRVRLRKAFEQVKMTPSGKDIEDEDVRSFGNKISSYACELVLKTMLIDLDERAISFNKTVSNFKKVPKGITMTKTLVTGHVREENLELAVKLFTERCLLFVTNNDLLKTIPKIEKFMGSNLALVLYLNYDLPRLDSKELYMSTLIEIVNKTLLDDRIKMEFYNQLQSRLTWQKTQPLKNTSYVRLVWGDLKLTDDKMISFKIKDGDESNLLIAHNKSVADAPEDVKKKGKKGKPSKKLSAKS